MKGKYSNDWVFGKWEQHCSAALASLDFFVSVFYQEKIESLAGEVNIQMKK